MYGNSDTSSIYDASVFLALVVVSVLAKDFQSSVVSIYKIPFQS